jgi:type II pantothenate kinase
MTSETYQADPAEPLPTGSGNGLGPAKASAGDTATAALHTSPTGRPRTATTTAEIDTAISHPGSVRINVKGAFIVDQGSATPRNGQASPTFRETNHETKDIRLPNHTAVVSHVAIDVCSPLALIS